MPSDFNWTCPYCQRAQVVGDKKHSARESHVSIEGLAEGSLSLVSLFIGCANADCKKLTATVALRPDSWFANTMQSGYHVNYDSEPIAFASLLPESTAKPQPPYIPKPIVDDYTEACRIRDLSPKASATLLRRCLQGMIRDFCGISKSRLIDEIAELRKLVDEAKAPKGVTAESVEAIDHVRQVGNIGAHMEADINHIVDVDPGEAGIMIELVEMLFEDWYVERQKREDRFARVAAVAGEKRTEKSSTKKASPSEPSATQ